MKTYAYEGARAVGTTTSVTAGEAPKVLTQEVTLLGGRHGLGKAIFGNGDVYEGEFSDGVREGSGTYTYASPPVEEGEEPIPPKAMYEGTWKAGLRSGVGVLTYTGGTKYQGHFKEGVFCGQGTMFYSNGDIHVGEWSGGQKNGTGTYISKASGARSSGTWAKGRLVDGRFADVHSNSYTGAFVPNGRKCVSYADGGTFALANSAACSHPGTSRLVLYASDTPDKADFVRILKPSVLAIEYSTATATADELTDLVGAAVVKNCGRFESAALACHGDGAASGFAWAISQKLVVTDAATIPADVQAVLHALGAATVAGGRVDLFACSLLATAEGKAVFDAVQTSTETHFSASSDLTGNAQAGQDWVMESDGVNVKPLYFVEDTTEFHGNFGGQCVAGGSCLYKFGKCSKCGRAESQGQGRQLDNNAAAGGQCVSGGPCLYKWGKCSKCGKSEPPPERPQPRQPQQTFGETESQEGPKRLDCPACGHSWMCACFPRSKPAPRTRPLDPRTFRLCRSHTDHTTERARVMVDSRRALSPRRPQRPLQQERMSQVPASVARVSFDSRLQVAISTFSEWRRS